MALLMKGLRGEPVKELQEKLGLDADGIFGSGTQAAVKAFQEEHNLAADGIAGAETLYAMELFHLVLLKRGSKGKLVQTLQEKLSIDADGKFGKGTAQAVKDFQESKGLKVDGLAGPDTLAALGMLSDQALLAKKGADLWDSLEESSAGTFDRIKKMFGA